MKQTRRGFLEALLAAAATPFAVAQPFLPPAAPAVLGKALVPIPSSRRQPDLQSLAADFDGDAVSYYVKNPVNMGRGFTTSIYHIDEAPFFPIRR